MCFSLYAILINRISVEKNGFSTEKWFLNHFSQLKVESLFLFLTEKIFFICTLCLWVLLPWPGTEPATSAVKAQVLTTGPLGNFLGPHFEVVDETSEWSLFMIKMLPAVHIPCWLALCPSQPTKPHSLLRAWLSLLKTMWRSRKTSEVPPSWMSMIIKPIIVPTFFQVLHRNLFEFWNLLLNISFYKCWWASLVRYGFNPWVGEMPWRRKWLPTPIFFPRKSYGPGGVESMGSQKVGHHLVIKTTLMLAGPTRNKAAWCKPRKQTEVLWSFPSCGAVLLPGTHPGTLPSCSRLSC